MIVTLQILLISIVVLVTSPEHAHAHGIELIVRPIMHSGIVFGVIAGVICCIRDKRPTDLILKVFCIHFFALIAYVYGQMVVEYFNKGALDDITVSFMIGLPLGILMFDLLFGILPMMLGLFLTAFLGKWVTRSLRNFLNP